MWGHILRPMPKRGQRKTQVVIDLFDTLFVPWNIDIHILEGRHYPSYPPILHAANNRRDWILKAEQQHRHFSFCTEGEIYQQMSRVSAINRSTKLEVASGIWVMVSALVVQMHPVITRWQNGGFIRARAVDIIAWDLEFYHCKNDFLCFPCPLCRLRLEPLCHLFTILSFTSHVGPESLIRTHICCRSWKYPWFVNIGCIWKVWTWRRAQ